MLKLADLHPGRRERSKGVETRCVRPTSSHTATEWELELLLDKVAELVDGQHPPLHTTDYSKDEPKD